jgi:hypothetical protein
VVKDTKKAKDTKVEDIKVDEELKDSKAEETGARLLAPGNLK